MEQTITWVGLDAHKATIQVAMLLPGRAEPVQWQLANEPRDVRRMVRKIQRAAPGEIRSCYEAGVCGYALQRQLEAAGMACEVIAPALVPVKRGDRIKTDKRDARKLATLLRAGLLTAVRPPTPAEEAARDLCRAREDVVEDLQRARHRLGKFLLRRGLPVSDDRSGHVSGIEAGGTYRALMERTARVLRSYAEGAKAQQAFHPLWTELVEDLDDWISRWPTQGFPEVGQQPCRTADDAIRALERAVATAEAFRSDVSSEIQVLAVLAAGCPEHGTLAQLTRLSATPERGELLSGGRPLSGTESSTSLKRVAGTPPRSSHEDGTERSFAKVGIGWLATRGLCALAAGPVFAVPKES